MTLMPILAEEQVEMAPVEPLELHGLIEGGDASVLRKTIAELRNTAFFRCQVGKYHEAMEKSSGEDRPSGSATT